MNRRLLLLLATAALLVTGWTVAFTCEDKAATKAASKASTSAARAKTAAVTADASGACTAEQKAACTPEQRAACLAKMNQTTAVTASSGKSGCASHATTAVTASSTAEGHQCARKAAQAASMDHCAGKGATITTAEGMTCSHAKGASAKTACKTGAGMAGANGLYDATVAGGPGCKHDGTAMTGNAMGCDACADMAQSDGEILAAGGLTQVVRLKNGVMFIHTATGAAHVRAIQAALQRRTDRLRALTAMGDRAKLCPECKDMRGAMASGKLTRETVAIEGGCLTLMTSNDRNVIAKLHAMAGEEMARNKS